MARIPSYFAYGGNERSFHTMRQCSGSNDHRHSPQKGMQASIRFGGASSPCKAATCCKNLGGLELRRKPTTNTQLWMLHCSWHNAKFYHQPICQLSVFSDNRWSSMLIYSSLHKLFSWTPACFNMPLSNIYVCGSTEPSTNCRSTLPSCACCVPFPGKSL